MTFGALLVAAATGRYYFLGTQQLPFIALAWLIVVMWMSAGLFSILVIATAAAQSCPANQINSDAQIITYGEGIIPAVPITAVPSVIRNPALIDPNLTFFSEVLGYSDDQIQQEVENALQFLSEGFGLDFSLSQPNELGVRFFQNATLQPVR